jgi:hypothetical protein
LLCLPDAMYALAFQIFDRNGNGSITCGMILTCLKSLTNFIPWCSIKHTSPWTWFELTILVVIVTNCRGSYKFNNHTITAMTAYQFKNLKLFNEKSFDNNVNCSDKQQNKSKERKKDVCYNW